jgi:hypothetical protein
LNVGTRNPLHYGRRRRTVLQGVVVTPVLAGVLSVVGSWLATEDAERSHIAGHWLMRALVCTPAIAQLAYVVPVQ